MPQEAVSKKTCYQVFAALMVLMLLTTGANFLDLGRWNLPIAMLIAASKGTLILLFFMEVRYRSRLTWLFASAAFLWVGIMLLLTLNDYWSRGWVQPDWRRGTYTSDHIEFPADGVPQPSK